MVVLFAFVFKLFSFCFWLPAEPTSTVPEVKECQEEDQKCTRLLSQDSSADRLSWLQSGHNKLGQHAYGIVSAVRNRNSDPVPAREFDSSVRYQKIFRKDIVHPTPPHQDG